MCMFRVWGLLFGWAYWLLYPSPALVRKNYARVRSRPAAPIRPGDTSVVYKPSDLGNPPFIMDFKVSSNLHT